MALEPAVTLTAPVAEQVATAVPATAVATALIVNTFVEVTAGQPALVAVNVKVTLPAVLSAALGV